VLTLFVVALVGLAAFVTIERRSQNPMVDFKFFRSRTFLGSSLVAFIVTFAMLSQFFFLALYMQNILHYSPLQAGVRFLPSTLLIIVMGPLAGRLTDRVGPRPLMTLGLTVVAAAIFVQSHITVHTGYGVLLPGFILMGIGMGLVMSPMSTAAMNSVDRTKAGVASGVLSMSRMVGGTFGVAVMGALIATIGRSKIDARLPHLPAGTRAAIANSLGGGGVTGQHAAAGVVSAVRDAFVSALSTGLLIGSIVTVVGAALAWLLIESKPAAPKAAERSDPDTEPSVAPKAELAA
jgi:MFS family permease